jgi:lysophospholipase L1-like esterase
MNMIRRIAASLALAAVAVTPLFAARGHADFTRYVALGTSYGAGVESNSLVISHQQWSYPAIIARQAGLQVGPECIGQATNPLCWQIPYVSQPGIGPELELRSISPLVIAPKSGTNGSPMNLNLPKPYNNLAIPGARVHDLLTLTGAQPATNTQTSFAQFILRGLGTPVQQALVQHPTFITLEIGGNDVLGAVLAGTPAALTPIADFRADYATLLDALIAGAPDAGMVAMSVADVAAVPFASTIPPVLVNPATNQPVIVNGAPVFFVADLGGGNIGQLTPGSLVTLGASSLLASGYGIPAALAPAFPNLPNVGKPLPDAVVLTPAELTAIQTRVNEVNQAIDELAGARNIPVVHLTPLLNRVKAGVTMAGVTIRTNFITGGFFSYDGFHPSDIGYLFIANEFIKTINDSYDTEIPLASISQLFTNNAADDNAALLPPTVESFRFAPNSFRGIIDVKTPATKRRAIGH